MPIFVSRLNEKDNKKTDTPQEQVICILILLILSAGYGRKKACQINRRYENAIKSRPDEAIRKTVQQITHHSRMRTKFFRSIYCPVISE